MFIRNASVLIPLTALLAPVALPPAAAAQEPAAILQTVRESIAQELPTSLRITAAGSGYAAVPGDPTARQHYRIESYTQELDLGATSYAERLVRLEPAAGGGKAMSHTDTRAAKADSPWSDQYTLWTTPLGFLAGAAARAATVTSDTLYGLPYHVVTFTTPGGQEVRGYINDKHVLERTRTAVEAGGGRTVQVEAVFFDWKEFDGVKFPSLIIHKEDDQVTRILVVSAVEPGGSIQAARQ